MTPLRIHVEGIGLWSKALGNFAALEALLAGQTPEPSSAKPAATALPPNERRRAPESVLLAAEVAGQAVAMSGRTADALTCVFASSHGDQAITDYMCRTLATAPHELSPIRFHNSVHNAPAGYWTIATSCRQASTAVCAQRASFGAGLLEAISHALADHAPVLLVCSDIAGVPPLVDETGCTQSFGCALVLSPDDGDNTLATLDVTLSPMHAPAGSALPALLADCRAANASAEGLPLLAMLARRQGHCALMVGANLGLHIALRSGADRHGSAARNVAEHLA